MRNEGAIESERGRDRGANRRDTLLAEVAGAAGLEETLERQNGVHSNGCSRQNGVQMISRGSWGPLVGVQMHFSSGLPLF